MTPTPEQEAIVRAVVETKDNLLIEALAGAAKTSTLVLIAKALPRTPILCLAFNKKIATEMQARLPDNCKAQTLNSLGHQAWGDYLRGTTGIRRLTLAADKCNNILRSLIKELPAKEQGPLWDAYSELLTCINLAKSNGHFPDVLAEKMKIAPLYNDAELFDALEVKLTIQEKDLLLNTLILSAEQALNGVIDFNDQILFPAIFRVSFPSYPLVLVDEAQDLSPLNHVLIQKLVRGRIIAVGDTFQAIYAFRGASETSMSQLREMFSMERYPLSITFRCPEAIAEHVRWRAPTIQSWEENPNNPGLIRHAHDWSVEDLPAGCAILCRNNAPLLACAIYLLRNGRYPKLWGNDISKGLIKTMEKLGPSNTKRKAAQHLLTEWEAEQMKRLKTEGSKRNLSDRVDCINIFLNATETIGEAIAYAKSVFEMQGPIDLATVHKAKGSEWSDVFILDSYLFGDEGQELNLRYVAATRTKRNLTYFDSSCRVASIDMAPSKTHTTIPQLQKVLASDTETR